MISDEMIKLLKVVNMNAFDENHFRVVLKGISDHANIQDASIRLASQLSASLEQIRIMLNSGHYVLRSGLSREAATKYASMISGSGANIVVEDELLLLTANLPNDQRFGLFNSNQNESEDTIINRLADYEKASGIMWIILGIIQCITIIGIIAGLWNIFAGWSRIKVSRKITERLNTVPKIFEKMTGLIVIGVINLLLGGIIGLLFVAFDFFIRDKVLNSRTLFNRKPSSATTGS